MNEAEFQIYANIEDSHWWFVGKRLILHALLDGAIEGNRVLDLGCGTGGVLSEWVDTASCFGSDYSEYALQVCRERGVNQLVRTDLNAIPFRDGSFDTVLALDVIEHLDGDVELLREIGRLCVRGGRAVIAVPAYDMLWSQHDETFGHKRRYTAKRLKSAVREAGLTPERVTYTNFFTLPPAAVWRLLSHRLGLGRVAPRHDFWKLPRPLNSAIVQLYRVEAALLKSVNLPMGVSVVCIARTD